ncbi:hypothetical protein TruAng_004723 [Truncatella angustata]|nr:hypothetical protein TruAng_004723 [Truncatella angustata]
MVLTSSMNTTTVSFNTKSQELGMGISTTTVSPWRPTATGVPRIKDDKEFWHEYIVNRVSGLPVDSRADAYVAWLLDPSSNRDPNLASNLFILEGLNSENPDNEEDEILPGTCAFDLREVKELAAVATEYADEEERKRPMAFDDKLASYEVAGATIKSWQAEIEAIIAKQVSGGWLNPDQPSADFDRFLAWVFTSSRSMLPVKGYQRGSYEWKLRQVEKLVGLAVAAYGAEVERKKVEVGKKNPAARDADRIEEDQLYLLRTYVRCCTAADGRTVSLDSLPQNGNVFHVTTGRSNTNENANAVVVSAVLRSLASDSDPACEQELKDTQAKYGRELKRAETIHESTEKLLDRLLQPGGIDNGILGIKQQVFQLNLRAAQNIRSSIENGLPKIPNESKEDLNRLQKCSEPTPF